MSLFVFVYSFYGMSLYLCIWVSFVYKQWFLSIRTLSHQVCFHLLSFLGDHHRILHYHVISFKHSYLQVCPSLRSAHKWCTYKLQSNFKYLKHMHLANWTTNKRLCVPLNHLETKRCQFTYINSSGYWHFHCWESVSGQWLAIIIGCEWLILSMQSQLKNKIIAITTTFWEFSHSHLQAKRYKPSNCLATSQRYCL